MKRVAIMLSPLFYLFICACGDSGGGPTLPPPGADMSTRQAIAANLNRAQASCAAGASNTLVTALQSTAGGTPVAPPTSVPGPCYDDFMNALLLANSVGPHYAGRTDVKLYFVRNVAGIVNEIGRRLFQAGIPLNPAQQQTLLTTLGPPALNGFVNRIPDPRLAGRVINYGGP